MGGGGECTETGDVCLALVDRPNADRCFLPEIKFGGTMRLVYTFTTIVDVTRKGVGGPGRESERGFLFISFWMGKARAEPWQTWLTG